jgi:hypothetical protein
MGARRCEIALFIALGMISYTAPSIGAEDLFTVMPDAQGTCPSDHPHQMTLKRQSSFIDALGMICPSRLSCGEAECVEVPTFCPAPPQQYNYEIICLSDDDLANARGEGSQR